MKRKIAILLSAMMVATAMPMTASAVQLKSDSVVNAGFGKVGSTIDDNADKYINYNTVDQLKSRESVLKLTIDNKETDKISPSEGAFTVTLTNGTFGDLQANASQTDIAKAGFAYKNTVEKPYNFVKVGDIYAVDTLSQSYLGKASGVSAGGTITGLPENAFKVSGGKVVGIVQNGQVVPVDAKNTKATELVSKIDELLTKLTSAASGDGSTADNSNTKVQNGTAEEMQKLLGNTNWTNNSAKDAVTAVKTALQGVYAKFSGTTTNVLPQIPYTMEILSSTEARVTPTVDITNDMIDIDGVDAFAYEANTADMDFAKNLSMEVYKDDGAGTITVAASADEVANVAKTSGGTEGYVLLCDKNSKNAPTASLLKLDKSNQPVVSVEKGKPYIALPLGGVKVSGDGAVKAKISSDYSTKVTGGEYTITKGTGEGSTTLVYPASSVKSFDESLTLDPITIRENVRKTIANGDSTATFTLKVNGGFKFDNSVSGTSLSGLSVTDASGANTGLTVKAAYASTDSQSTIKVTVEGLSNRNNPIGLRIEGLRVVPTNTKNFGTVELTVSGDGINSTTIKVADRKAIGFKLETAKEPTDIVVGRSYEKDSVNMNLQDNQTVEVKFSEAVPNSLVSTRSLDFNMPEGVKIVNADISENRNITAVDGNFNESEFEIINNGKTLRLRPNTYTTTGSTDKKSLASFKIKFELSVDPSFTGDIKCNVTGGGQGSDSKVETVIAKAIAPFKVEAKNTKINLGYQDYNTADIVITEAKPGMFLQNKNVEIGLKAPFKGGNTIGFSQASYEVSGGELEVKDKDFKVNDKDNGKITFKINRSSTKNPSTVTIKNVKIGTNRSVPFGSYNLTLGGDAVINNYSVDKDANGNLLVSNDDSTYALASLDDAKKDQLANQDRTEYFEVKDYVNVVTETGTFNETVKVTVGEKTVVVGGQTLDMDVAPYIQASSNSTMVPLRFVAVALGVDSANVANPDQSSKVAWDQNTKTVTIYYGAGTGQKIIQFQAGSNIMTVDGTRIPMEYGVKAEIKEGRMFVPFRALGQALGVSVTWDQNTKTAIYNENNARNANVTTTATETTTASTTATTTTTTESTTKKEDSTTSTTKAESSTETTTKANK